MVDHTINRNNNTFISILLCIVFAISFSPVLAAQEWLENVFFDVNDYLEQLDTVEGVKYIKNYEYPISAVLSPAEMNEYSLLESIERKRSFIRKFIRRVNPNPAANENKWFIQFLRRLRYVKLNYTIGDRLPYYDDRAKYYLRFGAPSWVYHDKGNPSTIDNEIWSYDDRIHDLDVYFVPISGIYKDLNRLELLQLCHS